MGLPQRYDAAETERRWLKAASRTQGAERGSREAAPGRYNCKLYIANSALRIAQFAIFNFQFVA